MGVKTHRELHSWWGVFAGTHRIWFLHLLLFFFSMFWVSSHPSAARGWQVALGGNSPIICLCFVGLIVPLHLFLWALGRFFTAGKALCTTQLYVSLLSQLLLMRHDALLEGRFIGFWRRICHGFHGFSR